MNKISKMFMTHKFITACALLLSTGTVSAENRLWTLSGCGNCALKYNADVKTGGVSVKSASEDMKKQARLFPSLSFSTTYQGVYDPFPENSGNNGIKVRYNGDYGLMSNE